MNSTQSGQPANIKHVFAKYIIAVIVSLGMCESVGIFGLALFFLGRDFQTLYLFLACSAIAMYFGRPKTEELQELIRAMQYPT